MKICNQKKYIVALSGGPDSIFLLSKLVAKVKTYKIIACHVNYNYRVDSNIDQTVCENFCKENNIKLEILNVKQDYDNLVQNFESWARVIRYDFFISTLNKYNFDKILVAHNMNDDVETFLMQKQKCSIVNYWGIEKKTFYNNIMIYRPIIDYKKSQILNYLKENKIEYASDSTNADLKFTRNKIRLNLEEDNFDKILDEKKALNQKLKVQKNKIIKIVANFQEKCLDLKYLKGNDEYEQILIFKFLELNGYGNLFYDRKKATIKEIVKELHSDKSFVKIEIESLIILKDRNKMHLIDKQYLKIINKPLNQLTKEEIIFFNAYSLVEQYSQNNFWVTNDWEKVFTSLKLDNKSLNHILTKQKKPYFDRWLSLVVYDESDKNILNINR